MGKYNEYNMGNSLAYDSGIEKLLGINCNTADWCKK